MRSARRLNGSASLSRFVAFSSCQVVEVSGDVGMIGAEALLVDWLPPLSLSVLILGSLLSPTADKGNHSDDAVSAWEPIAAGGGVSRHVMCSISSRVTSIFLTRVRERRSGSAIQGSKNT